MNYAVIRYLQETLVTKEASLELLEITSNLRKTVHI